MIITRTPVRVPLGGGGTDLPSYASRHGGFLVSASIDKYVFVTVNRRSLDRLIRASYSDTEIVESLEKLRHPLVREALRLTGIDGGLEITSIADVPANCGLGTSGSFTVGLLHALHTLKRDHISTYGLAEEACHIEIDVLGEPIGKHDQYLGAFGGITCLEVQRDGSVTVIPARVHTHVVEELERNILLFYTGLTRRASDILADQNRAATENDGRVIDGLHRIKDIGREVLQAIEAGKLRRFGELLHEHWETKRHLSPRISGDHIDRWYDMARANGAIGGKIMGAGGGGFFMFYCEDSKERVRAALAEEGLVEMRFRFEFEGCKVLVNF